MMATLQLGRARTDDMPRTLEVVLSGIGRVGELTGERLLDVGCGNGLFTEHAGKAFSEIHGIDIDPANIERFEKRALPIKYSGHVMSSAKMHFPDKYFDTVLSIETLEHVDDLPGTVSEISRVLRPGGTLALTVPNRWFPFETHGGVVFGHRFGRIPLITYFPPIHAALAEARVFTVSTLDKLFLPLGFTRQGLAYLWPTFEHGGNPFQRYLRWTLPLMRKGECSRVRFLGSSIVVSYSNA